MNPIVSVITAAYNLAEYIIESVESVLEQTFKDIEIIVADDGSSDNTRDILSPLIKDKQVVYLYQDNGGAASARNYGIQNPGGTYIGFLDADDTFDSQMIEPNVEELDRID